MNAWGKSLDFAEKYVRHTDLLNVEFAIVDDTGERYLQGA